MSKPRTVDVPAVGRRQLHFKRDTVNEEARTVDLTFSSEEPVFRFYGMEILDHSAADSGDLSRLNNGAALLFNHDIDRQLGVVESAEIDTARKVGRATVRFSKSPLGQEKFDEVKDGILTKVSFAYELDDSDVEIKGQKAGPDIVRFKHWRALEISLVTVPADDSVGVGRKYNKEMVKKRILLDPAPAEDNRPAGPTTEDLERARTEAATAERERVGEITELGARHNVRGEDIAQHIREGKSADEFVRFILAQGGAKPRTPGRDDDGARIGMNEKEIRSYSVLRAIRSLAAKRPVDGLEREASDAVAKRLGRDPEGFFLPDDIAARSIIPDIGGMSESVRARLLAEINQIRGAHGKRALSAGTDAAGGFTVATEVLGASLIELLRNATLMFALGARGLSGLVGDIAIPTHTGAVTASWLAEGSPDTPSDQTFGQLALTPRRLAAATVYSKQLLVQSSLDVEAFVRQDIAETLAVEKDHKAINGSGGTQPTGILATSGIGTVTITTPGQPSWANIIEFETDLATANADRGRLVYLVTPGVRGFMKQTLKVSGDAGAGFLWGPDNMVNGYEADATNQMPANGLLFGNFQDLIIADWAGIDIVVDPYSKSLNNQVQVVVNTHTDIGVRHAASFSKSNNI